MSTYLLIFNILMQVQATAGSLSYCRKKKYVRIEKEKTTK